MNLGNTGVPTQALRRRRHSTAVKTLPALLALILLAGCGGGGGGSSSSTSTTGTGTTGTGTTGTGSTGTTGTLPTAAQSVSAPALSNFSAILSEDVAGVSVGGTVHYTLALTNNSAVAATVIVDTIDGVNVPKAALRITNAAGQTVYPPPATPLDSPPAPPGSSAVTVQPGASLFETVPLAVFSTAGNYQAVATFTVAASATDTTQTVTLPALPLMVK